MKHLHLLRAQYRGAGVLSGLIAILQVCVPAATGTLLVSAFPAAHISLAAASWSPSIARCMSVNMIVRLQLSYHFATLSVARQVDKFLRCCAAVHIKAAVCYERFAPGLATPG